MIPAGTNPPYGMPYTAPLTDSTVTSTHVIPVSLPMGQIVVNQGPNTSSQVIGTEDLEQQDLAELERVSMANLERVKKARLARNATHIDLTGEVSARNADKRPAGGGVSTVDDSNQLEVVSAGTWKDGDMVVYTNDKDADVTVIGTKRKFDWYLRKYADQDDALNQRETDGTLKPLKEVPDFIDNDGYNYDDKAIPGKLYYSERYLKICQHMAEVNGGSFYDAEATALGDMERRFYFLVPAEWKGLICPVENVGKGLMYYDPPQHICAGVYALAKAQMKEQSYEDTVAIKWATLRVAAFKAGWFDNQKQCIRKRSPKNALDVFCEDSDSIIANYKKAYHICGFLPFLNELAFRSYGSTYKKENSEAYGNRAKKLALSAQLDDITDYMEGSLLYGPALRWIGVKRPMLVLQAQRNDPSIPNVFKVRLTSAPSGHAVITSACVVIEALEAAHWWSYLKKAGQFDDKIMFAVAEKITACPWKYHGMCTTYGLPPLTAGEKTEADKAKAVASTVAPLLQGFLDATMSGEPLGKIQTLKKYAMNNLALFNKSKSFFRQLVKRRSTNIQELFSDEAFNVRQLVQEKNPQPLAITET